MGTLRLRQPELRRRIRVSKLMGLPTSFLFPGPAEGSKELRKEETQQNALVVVGLSLQLKPKGLNDVGSHNAKALQ
ncbi:hypothetical protein CDL15_Pgr013169 [Punica granatum]|uniref:Uncharacterized protein n=1 Tax=Punica granatum TaxID=22663 RepID=A0A218WET8_PUNGR|nr:hypothetical protein CDL15_Pgr013169 [Punica granatum]